MEDKYIIDALNITKKQSLDDIPAEHADDDNFINNNWKIKYSVKNKNFFKNIDYLDDKSVCKKITSVKTLLSFIEAEQAIKYHMEHDIINYEKYDAYRKIVHSIKCEMYLILLSKKICTMEQHKLIGVNLATHIYILKSQGTLDQCLDFIEKRTPCNQLVLFSHLLHDKKRLHNQEFINTIYRACAFFEWGYNETLAVGNGKFDNILCAALFSKNNFIINHLMHRMVGLTVEQLEKYDYWKVCVTDNDLYDRLMKKFHFK